MNRIYKVIWNKTRGMYMVVSELAKGQSKDGRRAVGRKKVAQTAAALAVFFSIVSMGGTTFAADTTKVESSTSDTAVEVYTKDGTDAQIEAARKYTYRKTAELDKKLTDQKTSTALHISSTGDLIVGTKENQTVKDIEIRGKLTSGSLSTGDITSTGDVTVTGKVAADGVTDETTKDGTYIKQNNTVGNNLVSLDKQVKANDDRITAVKEYLQKEAADTYVSKNDAAVQDGAVVKAANTIGDNVTKLDAALAKETAARLGADAAQDKVIQQVNENASQGIATLATAYQNEAAAREVKDNELNERITNEANEIHKTTNQLQTDLNTETTAREAADAALDTRITNVKEYLEKQTSDNYVSKADAAVQDGAVVKAANTIGENVANLDAALDAEKNARIWADKTQDKVIQQVNQNMVDGFNTINKNMADGFNALSQADANELAGRVAADTELAKAVNGGLSLSDNNVLQKNTAKVNSDGTVSTSKEAATTLVMNEGKANQITLSENGIKVGLNSTVQDANGFYAGGDTADKAKAGLNADGSIKGANGAFTVDTKGNVTSTGTVQGTTLTDGKATISNGNIKTNGGFIQTGGGNVNTQGGEVRTNGGKVATSGGEINTGSGNIKTVGGDILTAGGKLNTSGGDIVAGTGNISGQNITASGVLSGDSLTVAKGMTGHSLTLTGGDLDAGAGTIKTTGKVEAGTLTTTGDATIGGNLTVDKNLTVNGEFNAETLSSKLDENNYTEIHGGNVTSVNSKVDITDGKTYTSTSTLTEKGKTETASNGINRNVEKMDATESSDVITNDANGQTSTFRQKIDQILQEIKASDTAYSKVDQAMDSITSTVTDGTNTTSVEQGTQNITNTAKQGTISNIAKDLVNTATGDMTNTVGGKMLNNVTGDMENKVGGNLTTTVGGNETHTVGGTLTETVTGDVTEDYKANLSTTVGGNQTTTVTGDSSLTAENITNEARNKITNKALDVETDASSSIVNKVSNDAGSNTSTQLSYQITEEMSQADGKKASYLRGAAEEKSQLTDGDKKTTIDTIAGQTNTNITDGTNTSNSLQKADQVASSVTDGTNTTVVNQDAKSLASSITDGTKANNTNSTVDKSEQLIKASDTRYSATTKTASKTEDALVSGNSVIDVIKSLDDAGSPLISSAVTDGTNSTGVTQTAKDITNTAKNGTIANEAKDITNNATENMTNTVGKDLTTTVGGEMKTTVTGDVTEDYKANLSTTVGGNQTTTVTGDSSLTAENITNTAKNGTIANEAKDIINNAAENMTNTVGKDLTTTVGGEMKTTVTGKTMENYNGGLETTITGEEKHTVNGSQINNITGDQTNTIGGNQTTTVTGNSSLSAQNITNTASETLSNSAKNITNTAAEKLSNSAAEIENTATKSIKDKVGENVSRTMTTSQIKESVVDGANSNTSTKTASKDMNIVTDGTSTSTLSQLAGSVNTSLKEVDGEGKTTKSLNNVQTVSEDTTKITDTASGSFSSSSQKADGFTSLVKNGSGGSNTVTDTATKSEQKLVSGNIIDILKDAENGYVNTTVSSGTGDDATKTSVTTTDAGTTFENTEHDAAIGEGSIKQTTISGNTLETGKATADYVDVNKDLHVMGNTKLDGTLEVAGKSTFKDDVTMEKDLSVGGNATVAGDVTAKSYKVGDKTYINENGINANDQKITNVADGTIAEGSTDAVNGGQLHATNQRVSTVENRVDRVETRVDNLDNRIDKVGANAAAMANLHPMDFDEDSKVSVAAAVGNYRSETAGALGVFYRPTDRVMLNVSTSFGNGENMVGGGVSFKLGKSSKRLAKAEATNAALAKQVTNLQNRLDALLGVLNPSLSKDFPDVPANHWAYEAVSRLAGNDIVQGYEDGKYHGERTMTRYEMAEIIYNALSKGAKAEAKLVEEFRPELQAMAAQRKA